MITDDNLKKIKYPVTFLFFIIIFKKKFLEIISSVLITPLLSTVKESNWLLEVSLFVLTLGIIGSFIYKAIKGYRVSMLFVSWTVTVTAVYFYFRFVYVGFDYIKFHSKYLTDIALTDTIFIVIIALVLYEFLFKIMRNKERKVQEMKEDRSVGFYTDIPIIIDEKKDDIYKRYQYIIELKDKILATKTSESSFAIGIIGDWGSGKTTFIDTLKGLFDKENDILQFKFNAWAASSPEKIIELFFSDLSSILSDFDGSLRNEIVEYFSLLVKSIDNSSISFLKEFIKPVENKTINQQYLSINNSIQKLRKKIIIYIDDVDRLNSKEIIEVLQLIRNTANFGNVYFIVAFERNYVLSAINKSFVPFNGNYIEKIFQLEYYLPISHWGQILESAFYEYIGQYIDEKSRNLIKDMRNIRVGFMNSFEVKPDVTPYIKNMRDVKRLINVFNLNYDRIKGNVYLPDYISICLLRLKYPDLYHSLYYNKAQYLTTSRQVIFDQEPGELFIIFQEKAERIIQNSILYKDIKQGIENKLIDPNALEGCKLVYHLFNSQEQNINSFQRRQRTLDKNHLSITENSCFERYFDFILEGRLDDNEFSESLTTDLKTFKKKIDKWSKVRATAADLQLRFENFTTFSNKDQFELIINGIIYFTELPSAENSEQRNAFNIQNFVEKIGGLDFEHNSVKTLYIKDSVESFKGFIEKIFSYKIHPMANTFLFQLAGHIIKNSDNIFVLKNGEIKGILKDAFIYTLQKESEFTNELMNYFIATRGILEHRNKNTSKPSDDEIIITEKFKNFIVEKGLVGFLKYNIFPYNGSEQLGYTLGGWHIIIFGSFNNFYKQITDAKGIDEEKNEFDDFYKKMDENGRVEKFEFNYLKKDGKE